MKQMLTLVVLVVLSFSFITAKEIATVTPAKPKIGDKITITYDPLHVDAALKDVKEMTTQIFLPRVDDAGKVIEIPMTKNGGMWNATFTLDDESARVMLLRFFDGSQVDDGKKNVWSVLIYGKNGKPLRNAQNLRSLMYRVNAFTGFQHSQDFVLAQKDIDGELKLYPDNVRAVTASWDLMYQMKKDSVTLKTIKDKLHAQLKKNKSNEENINLLLVWVERVYTKEKADSIRSVWTEKNPKGKIAEASLFNSIVAERDTLKRVELTEKYISLFSAKEQYVNLFANAFIRAAKYERAIELLKTAKNPVNAYNSIAWKFIEKGENLEQAVAWAKMGYEVASQDPKLSKPDFLTLDAWVPTAEYYKSMMGDTYAYGLTKLGKHDEALNIFSEAYAVSKGDDEDINLHFVECLIKNNQNEKALEIAFSAAVKGRANQQLLNAYKSAYTSVKGSDAGFDSVLTLAKNESVKELKAKLKKELIDQPSIDFELKSLDGSMVKLSELKGKVVVLDFWATWCGPCLSSFPSLQKVYDKYKTNPNIKILAMNTWERVKPEEREQHVKNFIEKNKYTFPVVFDTDLVTQYGVSGIPTKFIIDQNGRIRFKDVGFGGAQEMENKMNIQFEMLLNGDLSLSDK